MMFVIEAPVDNKSCKSSLIQVIAGHCADDKPLNEPMMSQFTDSTPPQHVPMSCWIDFRKHKYIFIVYPLHFLEWVVFNYKRNFIETFSLRRVTELLIQVKFRSSSGSVLSDKYFCKKGPRC